MTSPNPTSSEIDAFILEKVKEVVPEFEQSNDYIVDKIISDLQQMPITQDWWNFADEQIQNFTKQAMYAHTSRPIQLSDILQILDYTRCIVTCDRGYFRITPHVIGKGLKTRKTIDWNLSLDYAHQDEKTKLEIWKLIK